MMDFSDYMRILTDHIRDVPNRNRTSKFNKKLKKIVRDDESEEEVEEEDEEDFNEDEYFYICYCNVCNNEGLIHRDIVSSLNKMIDSTPFYQNVRYKISDPEYARNKILDNDVSLDRLDEIDMHQRPKTKFVQERYRELYPIENLVVPIIRMRDLMYRKLQEQEEKREELRRQELALVVPSDDEDDNFSRAYENYGP